MTPGRVRLPFDQFQRQGSYVVCLVDPNVTRTVPSEPAAMPKPNKYRRYG